MDFLYWMRDQVDIFWTLSITSIQEKDNKLNSIYFSFLQNQIKILYRNQENSKSSYSTFNKNMCQIDTILFGYLANCE